MDVSVEVISGLQRKISVVFPSEKIEEEINRRLQKMSKEVHINGFRPGKVPMSFIQKRFGEGVRGEVIQNTTYTALQDAIKQESLDVVNVLKLDVTTPPVKGKNLEFEAQVELYPIIQLADFSLMPIEKTVAEITESDIDDIVEKFREKLTAWSPIERAAQIGDEVTIDFIGYVDEKEFDGNKSTDAKIVLGSKQMIPGFEEGIVGKAAGEIFDIFVTFPSEYHAPNLAGKEAKFGITLKKVCAGTLPVVDSEFAKKVGVASGDLTEMREEIRKDMLIYMDNMWKQSLKGKVSDLILENHSFEIPQSMVISEFEKLCKREQEQIQNTKELPQFKKDELMKIAQDSVKLGIIFSKAIKEWDVKLDPNRVREIINNHFQLQEYGDEMRKYVEGNPQMLEYFQAIAMEEQVIEAIAQRMKITEVKKAYKDIVN